MTLSLLSIFGILIFITCFTLAIIVSIFGRQKIHRIWAFFNVGVAVWGLAMFFIGSKDLGINGASFWWKIGHIGAMIISVGFLHTMLEFCSIRKKKALIFFYLSHLIFFIILPFYDRMGYNLEYMFNSFYYIRAIGWTYPFATVLWFTAVIYGFIILVKAYIKSTGAKERNQFKYLFFGMAIGFVGGGSHFFPVYGIKIYPFNITIVLYTLIVTYAILRYRLMDIKIFAARAAIFVAVYALILAIPFGAAPYFVGRGLWAVPVIVMAILASMGPFVYMRLQRRAEDKLLRDQRMYQKALRDVSRGIVRERNLEKLLGLIAQVISDKVRVAHIDVFLLDKEKGQYILKISRGKETKPVGFEIDEASALTSWLRKERDILSYEGIELHPRMDSKTMREIKDQMKKLGASICIPSFIEEELFGFWVLGEKVSGTMYTQDDFDVFSTFANQAALAIESAQFLIEREKILAELAESRRLAGIGDMLGEVRHVIGNLLLKIGLYSGMLARGDYKEETQRLGASKTIDRNVSLANEILGWIKDYKEKSKSEELRSYKIDQMVDQALEANRSRLEAAGIKVTKEISSDLPKILGRSTLPDTFFHLIVNSWDGMVGKQKKTGPSLLLIQAKPSEPGRVEIRLSDTGIDLAKEIREGKTMGGELFAEQAKIGGISLFLARMIIRDHKGTIDIQSNDDKGTTFVVRLPIS